MKTFLITISLLVILLLQSQCDITKPLPDTGNCPPALEAKTINFKKPVVVNQVLDSIGVCDDDNNQSYTWNIEGGSNYFQIITNPNNRLQAFIITGNQNMIDIINKDGVKTYVIKVIVSDNGIPPLSSSSCTITLKDP